MDYTGWTTGLGERTRQRSDWRKGLPPPQNFTRLAAGTARLTQITASPHEIAVAKPFVEFVFELAFVRWDVCLQMAMRVLWFNDTGEACFVLLSRPVVGEWSADFISNLLAVDAAR